MRSELGAIKSEKTNRGCGELFVATCPLQTDSREQASATREKLQQDAKTTPRGFFVTVPSSPQVQSVYGVNRDRNKAIDNPGAGIEPFQG